MTTIQDKIEKTVSDMIEISMQLAAKSAREWCIGRMGYPLPYSPETANKLAAAITVRVLVGLPMIADEAFKIGRLCGPDIEAITFETGCRIIGMHACQEVFGDLDPLDRD